MIYKAIIYILFIVIAIVSIFPFYMVISNSFKGSQDLASNPVGIPKHFELKNYVEMFKKSGYPVALGNSLLITVFSLVVVTLAGSLAAFAIARFKFKRGYLLYLLFISGLLLPFNTLILPLFLIFLKLKLLNSIPNLILLYGAYGLPITIFVLTGFFKTLPKELEDAARIDGCSNIRVFFNIFLPLSKAPLSWIIILNALYYWNDFLFPLFFLQSENKRTLVVKMFYFFGQYVTEWNLVFAFITVSILPMIIIFIILQKYFISGVMAGAIKG
jgi:raffinose/stachyose/melibiose transport system permease protein